mmetsp:Transcript_33952/g.80612  ORF Transcript_33952/g.80612 Transcript_33952/m.80612 type:complete len:188 (+) Transcript_33952:738-1301(+)
MEIHKNNQILLEKLRDIAKRRPHHSQLQYTYKPGIRLTRSAQPKLDIEKTERFICAEPLRYRVRRDEELRIAKDNVRIGRRLVEQKPFYSSDGFRRGSDFQKQYLENCRKFRPSYSMASSPVPHLPHFDSRPKTVSAVLKPEWNTCTTVHTRASKSACTGYGRAAAKKNARFSHSARNSPVESNELS